MVKPNFSDDFMTEVLGQTATKKGQRASVPIENLKDLFRTTIYTNNPVVRQRILDTFTDIIPETLPGKSGLLEIRERLLTDPILKKYNLNTAIRGPIAKLLANDLNQITLEDIASFKRPVVGTTDILRFLGTRVDPKYKSMFEEATKAITYAQQNQWPLAKKAINSSQKIQFDHKIPISLISPVFLLKSISPWSILPLFMFLEFCSKNFIMLSQTKGSSIYQPAIKLFFLLFL